jgi:hypothetical protein
MKTVEEKPKASQKLCNTKSGILSTGDVGKSVRNFIKYGEATVSGLFFVLYKKDVYDIILCLSFHLEYLYASIKIFH